MRICALESLARARRLFAGYGEAEILHSLDFTLPATGICALVGPGGSGKTTLLRLIAPPGPAAPQPWRRGELVVPPRRTLFLAQARIPRPVPGGGEPVDRAERERRIFGLLEEDWELLLLDEPADLLDDAARSAFARALRRRDPARPVLLATHHLVFVREAADHILFLADGKLIEAAATEDFFERPWTQRTRDFLRTGS